MKHAATIILLFFGLLVLLVAIDSIPKAHSRAFGLRGAASLTAGSILVNTGTSLLVNTGVPLKVQ